MTQSRLNRAVARATGEDLATIKRMGFSALDSVQNEFDYEPAAPNVIDWDELDRERVALFPASCRRAA